MSDPVHDVLCRAAAVVGTVHAVVESYHDHIVEVTAERDAAEHEAVRLRAAIAELRARIAVQNERIAELEARRRSGASW